MPGSVHYQGQYRFIVRKVPEDDTFIAIVDRYPEQRNRRVETKDFDHYLPAMEYLEGKYHAGQYIAWFPQYKSPKNSNWIGWEIIDGEVWPDPHPSNVTAMKRFPKVRKHRSIRPNRGMNRRSNLVR